MPELPEVETVVRTLIPHLKGSAIRGVRLLRADILTPGGLDLPALLVGRTVSSIHRRGKRIVCTLDDSHRFVIHLGMTGRLTLENPAAPPLLHTHLVIDIDGASVHFCDPRRFGGIWWLGADESPDDDLGPEPLSLATSELARRLARTSRAIKSVLLDQAVLAGVGNIYADEALFAARIRPTRHADRLSHEQIVRLNRAIKTVLRRAIAHGGSTVRDYRGADGRAGRFQKLHNVYARSGLPCRVCGQPIRRRVLGGRSACFCPNCQR